MSDTISTIDTYIKAAPKEHQSLLSALRNLIVESAPAETTETISYKMPTFRYHGNLIHFALFKHHIGLYPGTETTTRFAEKLTYYKTSKGGIQLPLDKPLPKTLIRNLVKYNADKLKGKNGPNWHINRGNWGDAEKLMLDIIADTALTPEFKWGTTIYTYKGKNVVAWGGFKNFFSIWFYNGVFLKDKEKVLVAASAGKTKSLRQWRFTDPKDMSRKKIMAYIRESIQTVKEGKEIKPAKAAAPTLSGLLKKELDKDPSFKDAFKTITPGRQREYIEYIDLAKQDTTKISRISKIKPLVMAGKGLHDKYKR